MLNRTEILTSAQMRAIESAAIASGTVTSLELMERAGAEVAGQIRLRWPKPARVTVLCGPGNNGGDGYAIARHLHRAGWRVDVLGLENDAGPDATEMRRRWSEIGTIQALAMHELRRMGQHSDVYVDAIFGTGLTRAPKEEIAAILSYLSGPGGDGTFFSERLVAVDCPSGLCLDSGTFLGKAREPNECDLHARLTVAFDSPKVGHLLERGPECCGEVVIVDIGLQQWRDSHLDQCGPHSQRTVVTKPHLNSPESQRSGETRRTLAKQSGHKFTHGHALVVAGSTGQGGAARLSARAALRIGAGLVTIGPPMAAMIEHAGPPDALMRRTIENAEGLATTLEDRRINALCLGPGTGVQRATALLPTLLASRRMVVLDADALTALADAPDLMSELHESCVLTPHNGEFARLFPDIATKLSAPARQPATPATGVQRQDNNMGFGQQTAAQKLAPFDRRAAVVRSQIPSFSKLDATREAAARCGAVVLLKGPDTVIASPTGQARIHSNFDVPWLATAGSGDVLAGIVTGLLARGLSPLDAADMGVALHAAAARRFGPGLIADDLPEQITGLFRDMQL